MKSFYKVWLCVTGLVMATACEKYEPLEFEVEKPTTIAAQEEIDAYGDLKTYVNRAASPNFKLGSGVSMSEYNLKGVIYRMTNRNFDEITPRTELNHGSVVLANGTMNLANIETLIANAKEGGTSIFGQSLTWHMSQNATYLRSLITPLIVESPVFVNSLNLTNLSSGTLQGWSHTNGVSVVNNEGMGGGKAVRLVSSSSASQPQDLQLVTPAITVIPGKEFEVMLFIKSDKPGRGRISFEGLSNNTPMVDWMKTGQATETFTTGAGWRAIKFKVSDFQGTTMRLKIDLGYVPDVTYHVDVVNMYVYDTQGARIVNNLIADGDFETGTGWGGWGGNSTRGVTAAGEGVQGGKAFWVTNPSAAGNFWNVQTLYELPTGPLENGAVYNLSFWVKGTVNGTIRPEMQSPDFSSNGFGAVSVTTQWTQVNLATTITAATRNRFVISYGEYTGTVYIDKVVLTKQGATTGGQTTIVEKTADEKKSIILTHMNQWISGIVKGTSGYIKAWDVVKDAIDNTNPDNLRTGVGIPNQGTNEFYWQDFIGKEYGVHAFKTARANGNASDLHFISDNNLHSNLAKTRGLIKYVEYLEAQGAKVDGFTAQMQININTNKDGIREMLELLAATGKMVRISELEVSTGVPAAQATPEIYELQKEMYKYVVEKYLEIIPASKRYGVSILNPVNATVNNALRDTGVWGVLPNLTRRSVYAGLADALKSK